VRQSPVLSTRPGCRSPTSQGVGLMTARYRTKFGSTVHTSGRLRPTGCNPTNQLLPRPRRRASSNRTSTLSSVSAAIGRAVGNVTGGSRSCR
jgi:hypothetical protein